MRSQRLFEIRREVIEALKKLAKEINATIYLFGSYARGDHTIESDVDIVIVCECFEGMKYMDRVEFIRAKLPRNIGFDIIVLTPEELSNKMRYAFFKDISKYWIEIKP
ncbi:MAG: nucleotidyltransferase domain-containing protein [Desulfurococcaceae archaeon]